MAKAVGNAFVVCCFMTQEYENSLNCKLELEHAQRCEKRIIPCMVSNRKLWKPSKHGWLNFITGSKIAIDFSGTSDEHISDSIKKLIDEINQKPSNSSSSSVSKPSDFFISIRHEYLRNSRIQRMMNEEKSFPIEESYINLAIVETEEQREKEKKLRQTQYNDAIISSFEEIYGTKTSINVQDIFEKCKNQEKRVLVLGRAGIGKSTFCRYVSYQWAKNELWTQYELVILIRLRLLTSSRYPPGQKYLPIDIVEKEYFPCDAIQDENRQRFKELCKNGQVLWLLDGYDEFVQNIPEQLSDVFDYIRKTYHNILTSRPYSIALPYDVRMEITGFTDDNIVKYVEQFFDQIKNQLENALSESQKLLSFLKMNPGIWGVAHIPVNLELICSLWGDIQRSEVKIMTMTSLYDAMTEWLCRRYLTKQKNLSMIETDAMLKDDIYVHCRKELIFLENLAFQAMKSNTLILKQSSIENALKDADVTLRDIQHIFNMGVLKSFDTDPTGNQGQTKKDYYFIHLSFQEHFAARYLVNSLGGSRCTEAIEFINSNKYNQRFLLMFTFASGLLTEPNLRQSLNIFWNTLLDEPLDLIGLRHIQLLVSCSEEATDKSVIPRYADLLDSISKWLRYAISTRFETINDQLVRTLQRSTSLIREQTITDQLVQFVQRPDTKVRSRACSLISDLSTYNLQPQFLFLLIIALGDENEDVRSSACWALVKMGEKAATSEVINKLVSALGDENENVRGSACETLGEMGEKAATSEVINKLVSALGDENENVRGSACETLGEMGEKAATSEVINKLVSALGDESAYVRSYTCEALGKMGEKAATSEVINKLMSALGDENENVRGSACETLGEMGEKAATSEVINKLVSALGDESAYVRRNACGALDAMGEKAATSEVINKLVSALGDEDEDVTSSACWALVKMGEKAATSEVINKLVSALGDENKDVRDSACEVLGKIGEKTATSEVINKLVSALGDENENVRGSACETLGEMGEKAATSEVINKLVSALGDENENVRGSACETLGEMGEKAATSEVINKLVSALGDESAYVRSYTCEALGKMGEKAATSEVINKLVSALGDENENVRGSACETLGEMGEKAATSEVINKLVSALGDESAYVRSYTCEALGKMGEKAATSEVINKLMSALGDENENVRSSACWALVKMGEKAATSEVINKLVSALGDENENVKGSACETLGEMGEKAATSEVINKLVSALGDESAYVRSFTCEALGKMGEKTATSEVINKLVSALGDENADVRRDARDALSKMGEKAATSEVINKLVAALGDENKDVRIRACEALGKMGEKAATSEVIRMFLRMLGDSNSSVKHEARIGLEKSFGFLTVKLMTELDSDIVRQLLSCLEQNLLGGLEGVSPAVLIEVFLYTKSADWLSVATLVTLRQGSAVSISENTISVFDSKEPVRLHETNRQLLDQLVNAFIEQAMRLELPCMRGRKSVLPFGEKEVVVSADRQIAEANVKSKMHSSMCSLL